MLTNADWSGSGQKAEIAPLPARVRSHPRSGHNAKIALDHRVGEWTNSVELQLVGSKDQLSQVHNGLTRPAYALINLRTGYRRQQVRVDFGIDNLINQNYYLPLGGADLVDYKVVSMMGSSAAWGYNLKGPGRSLKARLSVSFWSKAHATRPFLHDDRVASSETRNGPSPYQDPVSGRGLSGSAMRTSS